MTTSSFDRVIQFLQGEGTDHKGRTREFVLAQSDEWLEDQHDYVQWLFPSEQPSEYNPFAPVLTRDELAKLGQDPKACQGLLLAYVRMLQFWGLQLTKRGAVVMAPKGDSPFLVTPAWMRRADHNDLRFTRALACLHLTGLDQAAKAFLAFLQIRFKNTPQKQLSLQYWQSAVLN